MAVGGPITFPRDRTAAPAQPGGHKNAGGQNFSMVSRATTGFAEHLRHGTSLLLADARNRIEPRRLVLPRGKEQIMATKKLSLLLVAFLTCASQPALTQGGGGGGGGGGAGGGGAGGGAAAGSAGGGTASSGNTGNAGGQAGPPSTTSGDAGGQVGAPIARSGDASGQVGDNERFYQSVTPAASAYKQGVDAKNAPSASRYQAVPPPNARPNSDAGTTLNARPGSGIGTTPNGRPVGSAGSGPGSPEQPY